MFVIVLKLITQFSVATVAIMALLKKEPYVTDQATGKKSLTHFGKFAIGSLLMGLLLFAATDTKERDENRQKDDAQKQQISNLKRVVKGQKEQLELQQKQISLSQELNESQKGLT